MLSSKKKKKKEMIKGKKNNQSHIHCSSTESTVGRSRCVCQTPERDTIDGVGGGGGGAGVALFSREDIVNNGKVWCTERGNYSDRTLLGRKMELNTGSIISDLSFNSPFTWGLPGADVSPLLS